MSLASAPVAAPPSATGRAEARGKFLFAGGKKLWVRGVTYGTFRPDGDGVAFPDRDTVRADFAAMAHSGINAVRTYEAPPPWLLDFAGENGLKVMVGLAWEQHVDFLASSRRARAIADCVRKHVHASAGHPAVLCYAVGNEIPASIARWRGARAVERFLERLYSAAKDADPAALVTYVNYPTTEYLQLPFLDLVAFNVFLEERAPLDRYLARLQNLAGERPLILTEIGLDSRRRSLDDQAAMLGWQVRAAFAAGCAGAFVFSWTDEWHRGGHDVDDWDFGLTDRRRIPKPSLQSVAGAFREAPFPQDLDWPRVSVVVCSYNGARTIEDCLDGLAALDYPDYEVIVVNDGSTDATPAIAARYPFRLISTENRGLSSARNTGWREASGEIVAYIDDDARPDPHWLRYLAWTVRTGGHAGAGGPNLAPHGEGFVAECVANSPGGPMHVLVSDREAEHVPGCNMAFRRDALQAVGGFDPRFRVAGDDVDLCWRLRDRGWTLGFHAGAMVWHHRRNSLNAYWRQQVGYGKAEALLEAKWPERYNSAGHLAWEGRIYGRGLTQMIRGRAGRIYQGVWGAAPYQTEERPGPSLLWALPLMPEWYLAPAGLLALALIGLFWPPLLYGAAPLAALTAGLPVLQAAISARQAGRPYHGFLRWRIRAVTLLLHLLQPAARLWGRLRHGLTPWRGSPRTAAGLPRTRTVDWWTGEWRAPGQKVKEVESALRARGARVTPGGPYERWDLEVRNGFFSSTRVLAAVEEHGSGVQHWLFRVWPRLAALPLGVLALLSALALAAGLSGAWVACGLLAAPAVLLALAAAWECGAGVATVRDQLTTLGNAGKGGAGMSGAGKGGA